MTRRLLAAVEGSLALVGAFALSLTLMAICLAVWAAVDERSVTDLGLMELFAQGGDPTAGLDPAGSIVILTIALATQSLVFAMAGFGMGRWRTRRSTAVTPWSLPRALGLAVAGGVAAIVGTIVISGVMTLFGLEVEEQTWVLALVRSGPGALWKLAPWIVVVGPLAEEVFFRFYLFRFFSERVGTGFGYIASAVLFAVVHFHLPAFPLYLFYGLLLAWVYRRTSRLAAPILTHALINLVSVLSLVAGAAEVPV